MSADLAGRCAVITGAGGGLGRAFALGFAAAGARVVAVDRDRMAAARTGEAVANAGGEAVAVLADVADEASTQAMAMAARDAFGSIDVLVNNAAVYAGLVRRPFDEIEVAEWDRVMAVNLRGPWLTDASRELIDDAETYAVDRGAIKRSLQPDDLVGAALFLASDASAMVTGQTIVVDGGRQFL